MNLSIYKNILMIYDSIIVNTENETTGRELISVTKKNYKYVAMVVLGVIIFSTFEVVTKTMNGALTGMLLTCYRFLIGGLVLLPFGIRDMKKRKVSLTKKDVGILILLSFLLVTVCMTLAQYGIFYSGANISAVLFSSNPLFITLFAAWLLKEKLNVPKIAGLLIGIGGLVITCWHLLSDNHIDAEYMMGVGITIIAMIIFCFYTVLNKKLIVSKIGPTASTAFTSVIGALTMVPIIGIQGIITGTNTFAFPIMDVFPQFLYCSIVGTGIAYLFYFTGLANVETSTGSMIFLIKPPLASIFATLFLNETITKNIVVGIVLILVGMVVSIKMQPRHEYKRIHKRLVFRHSH